MKKIIVILLSVIVYYACDKEDSFQVVKPEVAYSEFTDERDMTVYKCIRIGDQTWMAENLKYRLPMGSIDGCYTYREADVNLDRIVVDYGTYQDSLQQAISRGEVIDPPGAPIFQCPTFLLPMYFDYFRSVRDYIEAVSEFFPDLIPLFTRINDNLIGITITLNMETTDLNSGGYYKDNGFLYTREGALRSIPEGWRLPTDEDWKKLEETLGMPLAETERMEEWRGSVEGMLIKAGENGCGFNALLSGARVYGTFAHGTPFLNKGAKAYFWSSTKQVQNDTTDYGVIRILAIDQDKVMRATSKLNAAYSVRCIKE